MSTLDFFTAESDGKNLVFPQGQKERLRDWIETHKGKRVMIKPVKSTRSNSQNSFYWLYLELIEKETGHNSNELHEMFKRLFLQPKFIKMFGKEIKVPGSTTSLSKVEFGEYLEKICSMTNVPLPNPEEAGFITNYGNY